MPYDGMGNWVDSKTDLTTDMLGFGEIGGVGQLVYKLFRFKLSAYLTSLSERRHSHRSRHPLRRR